jgi:eukaryotic-like serine/threonine-protein kinase
MHSATFPEKVASHGCRMTAGISTHRHDSTARLAVEQGLLDANRVVDAAKLRWRQGETPDVTGVLASHPEIQHYRSVVLDLAYTEYRLRQEAGEPIDAATFAERFPSLQKSLFLLIEVHGLISLDPELQALQEGMLWPEAGSRFLQFDLVAEIGRGAFGRVFLATEPAVGGRQIVVKIAPHGGGEAGILGKLRHPNIVPIYSFQEDQTTGLAAFCMPYLGRATLCDVLDQLLLEESLPSAALVILDAIAAANSDFDPQESLSPALILRKGSYVDGIIQLAAQLAEALAHAHGRGIYHRDLKPSNVLMTSEGRPLLLDFNLSVDAALPAWKVGGTLPYMPPEELANLAGNPTDFHPLRYDPRSDLFSLGVIVYELLTGKLPFGAVPRDNNLDEMAGQLRSQQAKGPRPIRELNGQVDRRLARLVESCLAFEPDRRPETSQKLAAAFRQELSVARRSRRWMGNHRRWTFGTGAAFLIFAVAATAFFAFRPSYSVRQYQAGLACLEQNKYSEAVDNLNNSIRFDPNSAEALFARGRAYQRLGEYQAAFRDYDSANLLAPQPVLNVYKGYCSSQSKHYTDAIALYNLALKGRYDRPALAYNNIGFSYLMLNRLDEAEKNLQLAIQCDDRLQAAQFNTVMLFLQRAWQGQPVPEAAFTHASRAMEIGPPTADLYRAVAALHAMAAKNNRKLILPAIEYVGRAVEMGLDPNVFTSDASYATLQNEPPFREALKKPSAFQSPRAVRLIDPLDTL